MDTSLTYRLLLVPGPPRRGPNVLAEIRVQNSVVPARPQTGSASVWSLVEVFAQRLCTAPHGALEASALARSSARPRARPPRRDMRARQHAHIHFGGADWRHVSYPLVAAAAATRAHTTDGRSANSRGLVALAVRPAGPLDRSRGFWALPSPGVVPPRAILEAVPAGDARDGACRRRPTWCQEIPNMHNK